MHNFKDYLNFSPNAADNAYRLRQLALQEAQDYQIGRVLIDLFHYS